MSVVVVALAEAKLHKGRKHPLVAIADPTPVCASVCVCGHKQRSTPNSHPQDEPTAGF